MAIALSVMGCPPKSATSDAGVSASWAPVEPVPGDDLMHGRYLATIGACLECHTPRESGHGDRLDERQLMSGGIPFEGPWGLVHSANVSMVAARYEAAHLEAALRGQLSFKFQMPTELYAVMAADDMRDLVAYLRSLKPVEVAAPKNALNPSYRPPAPWPVGSAKEQAPKGVTVERGEYLVHIAICKDCHSPRAADGIAYDETRAMSGGGIGIKVGGAWLIPPNLTPDDETGLGRWSDQEIITAFRTGKARDGRALHPMMPAALAYAEMTDDDAKAIVTYLRSLPPVRAKRPPNGPYEKPEAVACCFVAPGAMP